MARNGFDIRHVSKVGCLMQLHVFLFSHNFSTWPLCWSVSICVHQRCSSLSCPFYLPASQPRPTALTLFTKPTALRFRGFPELRCNTVMVAENDPRLVGGLTFASTAFSEHRKSKNCRVCIIVELQIHFWKLLLWRWWVVPTVARPRNDGAMGGRRNRIIGFLGLQISRTQIWSLFHLQKRM